MFRYDRKTKALHAFEPVRVLNGRDLYARYGNRVPVDTDDFLGFSRNPLERMDNAMSNAAISLEEHTRLLNDLEKQQQQQQQQDTPPPPEKIEDSSSE